MKEAKFLEKLPQARIWVEAGIRPDCAGKLVRAGYTSVESLASASREDLISIRGVGIGTLETLERLLGHPFPRAVAPDVDTGNRRRPPETTEAWEGVGLMMAGARRLRASAPAGHESRDLLEQADRELREIEDEVSRLLIRKRLVQVLRHSLGAGRLHGTEV